MVDNLLIEAIGTNFALIKENGFESIIPIYKQNKKIKDIKSDMYLIAIKRRERKEAFVFFDFLEKHENEFKNIDYQW